MKKRLWMGALISILLMIALPIGAQEDLGVSAEVIEAYPEPNVTPLTPSDSVLYDRIYRKVNNSLTIYDAPNGNVVNKFGVGYNFVTLNGQPQGDWAQIGANQWVQTAGLTEEVTISRFTGVLLPEEGLPYTMAWTLRHLRPSETPGGEQSDNNPFMYRYSRVNIYATVEVDGYNWYQVGENQWVHQFNVAKILPIARPADVNTEKWVSVDLYEQVLIAYEGETPVFATMVSSGLPEWSTNEGTFNVYLRRQRTTMSGAYNQPDFYYLEEVPWTMFYDGDIALHGTFWHDGFGYRQSHGCVNMTITDSRWLFEWSADVRDFTVENSPDLSVHVYSSGEYN
ncbi:MAG: L,D-transpeptidase [Chloroflexota bacterium]